MNSILKKAVLSACLLVSGIAYAQESIHKQIEQLCSEAYHTKNFNGSAIVLQNDSVLYSGSKGFANEEWEVENTADTRFKIGSCTKQFTAAIILLLAEEGKINLDSTIATYWPEYPKPAGNQITIDQLLSHKSGIPEYFAMTQVQNRMAQENNPEDFIQCFWNEPLDFEPGSSFKYSNSGYYVLGYLIECVTGKNYAEVLQKKILDPLKMNQTGVDNAFQIFPNKAYGYIHTDGALKVAPFINSSCAYSAGAIYSTVGDLAKWTNSFLNETLLSHQSTLLMTSLHSEHYGYGLGIINFPVNGKSVQIFGHEGEISGYRSLLFMLPQQKVVIAILDNHNNTKLFALAKGIMELLITQ